MFSENSRPARKKLKPNFGQKTHGIGGVHFKFCPKTSMKINFQGVIFTRVMDVFDILITELLDLPANIANFFEERKKSRNYEKR